MAISEKAKEITRRLYIAYGSDTGYLFGILPDKRSAVEAVVQSTLDIEKELEDEDISN